MRNGSLFRPTLVFVAMVCLLLIPQGASPQKVGIVTLDSKEVAKGYRVDTLRLKPVVNEKGETIGLIDDSSSAEVIATSLLS